MAKREIIKIDQDKCTGCGECIPNCPEGALQIIDDKARLISDLFCDGLGACIGHCPEGAISIEEREAEMYNEKRVMENIIKQGENVIKAHLEHLKEHNAHAYLKEAIDFLKEKNIEIPVQGMMPGGHMHPDGSGCPGAKVIDFRAEEASSTGSEAALKAESQLRQWPIQLHLVSPLAPYFQGADVLLVADCVAYAMGSFHQDFLKGKSIAIACPKLDQSHDAYVEKIKSLFDAAKINTLTVLIMEVPCCRGLLEMAKEAAAASQKKVPVKAIVVNLKGEILSEEWA